MYWPTEDQDLTNTLVRTSPKSTPSNLSHMTISWLRLDSELLVYVVSGEHRYRHTDRQINKINKLTNKQKKKKKKKERKNN